MKESTWLEKTVADSKALEAVIFSFVLLGHFYPVTHFPCETSKKSGSIAIALDVP